MKFLFSFFILSLAFFSLNTPSLASEIGILNHEPVPSGIRLQPLLNLTSDAEDNKYLLNAMVEKNGNPAGLYKQEATTNIKSIDDSHQNVYWLKELESEKGAVLLIHKSHDVLILQGVMNHKTWEGKFVLKYLTNGLNMSYESCEIYIKRSPAGWYIQNSKGETVQNAVIETSFVGVRGISGLCPQK